MLPFLPFDKPEETAVVMISVSGVKSGNIGQKAIEPDETACIMLFAIRQKGSAVIENLIIRPLKPVL